MTRARTLTSDYYRIFRHWAGSTSILPVTTSGTRTSRLSKASSDHYECPVRLSVRFFPFRELTPISTEIGDGKQYASSRDFAAATGLVPRQYSTGGRTTLLGISKRGNKKIRTLLVQCARVFIQKLEHQSGRLADWVRELLCRKSNFVVTCALANKLARIARALTTRQQTYEA